ncbi:hypothetical protein BHYA_0044g00210 [Botrytis hyacinthi]|uniref:Uncharacterized protein n=1 Tax=Botrytis hyacinthi TaxID=278943 RepID=A0A4Z1GY35_9HELO|nr:hypothetical protein BHYA_0044g00210 [Botrytis hyacinthi]
MIKGESYAQVSVLCRFCLLTPEEVKTYARYHLTTNSDALTFILTAINTAKDHFDSAANDLDLDVATIDKEQVREKCVSIAKKSIAYHMGTTYMGEVISCLVDTYRGHTSSSTFLETFQTEIIEKLSA